MFTRPSPLLVEGCSSHNAAMMLFHGSLYTSTRRALWVAPLVALLIFALSGAPSQAWAGQGDQGEGEGPGDQPCALDIAVATVPGFVVHGAGHFVAGDSETAWIERAPLDATVGYQYVYNPTFEFGHFRS
jgi:hypothetical protein